MKSVIRMLLTVVFMLSIVNIGCSADLTRPKALELLKKYHKNVDDSNKCDGKLVRSLLKITGLPPNTPPEISADILYAVNSLADNGYINVVKEETRYGGYVLKISPTDKLKPYFCSYSHPEWIEFKAYKSVPVEITGITQGEIKDTKIVNYKLKIVPNELNKYLRSNGSKGHLPIQAIKEKTLEKQALFRLWDDGWRLE